MVVNYAASQRLIDNPVDFGESFKKPKKKAKRRDRRKNGGAKLFTREEVRRILDAPSGNPVDVPGGDEQKTFRADPQLYAMTLLSLSSGLGNSDVANLHESHLDLDAGWLPTYPRQKTEIDRRIPLWPETVDALKVVLAARKRPRDRADPGIVFLTRTRHRWIRTKNGETPGKDLHLNALSQAFAKVLKKLKINCRRNLGYYALRHTFAPVGGEVHDRTALKALMGHAEEDMLDEYEHGISDERLLAITDHVRQWALGNCGQRPTAIRPRVGRWESG